MRVGFYQFQPSLNNNNANREKIRFALETMQADLIVLPELCNSGYLFTSRDQLETAAEPIDGKTAGLLVKLSQQKECVIVAGLCEKAVEHYYNSSILVTPSGNLRLYRKLHLFGTETKWFTPGDRMPETYSVTLKGQEVKLGMMICYDWRFPEVARSLSLAGAQVVCHPSNLVMPYAQEAMVTRCLENRVFSVTANRIGRDEREGKWIGFTGCSQVVDPDGKVLLRATADGEEYGTVEIDPEQALSKRVTEFNDLFSDRRTDLY